MTESDNSSPYRVLIVTAVVPEAKAIVTPLLAEWDYGIYEGKTYAEIISSRPGWNIWRDGCPDGESVDFELVAERNSTMMEFDPSARRATRIEMAIEVDRPSAVISPNTPAVSAAPSRANTEDDRA